MKNNPYYLDFSDQKGMTIEQVRKIKENNHAMAVALNQLAKAVKMGPTSIRSFRKQLGNHDVVKYPDSETGMNTHEFTDKLRFLAARLENDKVACVDFLNLSACGKGLSYLFSGYVYTESDKDFCDKYCKWREYKQTENCEDRFKNRDPLTIALYLQKREDILPIGLDYAKMLDSVVTGENNNYEINIHTNDARQIIAAVEQQIFDLKTNETFYKNFYNDYYSKDDDDVVKSSIARRNRDFNAWQQAAQETAEEERE